MSLKISHVMDDTDIKFRGVTVFIIALHCKNEGGQT